VTGTALKKVALNPQQRAGILTQVGFLASHAHAANTSPVHRGLFIRSQFLCQETPPPPPQVNVTPPEDDPTRTRRQLLELHLSEEYCASCHRLIDPLGYALEPYDALGQYRTMDNGKPINATGTVDGSDITGMFDGGPDLARKLAASAQVQRCAVEKVFTYALARRPGEASADADLCAMKDLEALFAKDNHDIKELLVQVAASAAFRFRVAGTEEVCR
jgi:hypothetical protein